MSKASAWESFERELRRLVARYPDVSLAERVRILRKQMTMLDLELLEEEQKKQERADGEQLLKP